MLREAQLRALATLGGSYTAGTTGPQRGGNGDDQRAEKPVLKADPGQSGRLDLNQRPFGPSRAGSGVYVSRSVRRFLCVQGRGRSGQIGRCIRYHSGTTGARSTACCFAWKQRSSPGRSLLAQREAVDAGAATGLHCAAQRLGSAFTRSTVAHRIDRRPDDRRARDFHADRRGRSLNSREDCRLRARNVRGHARPSLQELHDRR
jgi:hypothetical protein